jgi:hypothetical protein
MEELNNSFTEQENNEKTGLDKEMTRREFLRDAGILAMKKY